MSEPRRWTINVCPECDAVIHTQNFDVDVGRSIWGHAHQKSPLEPDDAPTWIDAEQIRVVEASPPEQAKWLKLFNRLDTAISRHRRAKGQPKRCVYCGVSEPGQHTPRCAVTKHGAETMWARPFADDADDALHAAHDRVLKAAARTPGEAEGGAPNPDPVAPPEHRLELSGLSRARGFAQAIAEAKYPTRATGVRAIAAEIEELLRTYIEKKP